MCTVCCLLELHSPRQALTQDGSFARAQQPVQQAEQVVSQALQGFTVRALACSALC